MRESSRRHCFQGCKPRAANAMVLRKASFTQNPGPPGLISNGDCARNCAGEAEGGLENCVKLTTCAYHTDGIPGPFGKILRDFEEIRR
jgi:hypothetical protein